LTEELKKVGLIIGHTSVSDGNAKNNVMLLFRDRKRNVEIMNALAIDKDMG